MQLAVRVEAERVEGQAGGGGEALARGLVADADDAERDARRLSSSCGGGGGGGGGCGGGGGGGGS